MEIKTFFDFCSGIGGGRLGLEQCGLKCIGRSETSRLSEITYKLLHDVTDDKNYGNLKKLSAEKIPPFDLLIAGFPCQTFSVIGRRDGFDDDRGQIIFHLVRLLEECKPKCFILENVRGLVSHDKGKTINIMIEAMKNANYDVDFKILTSLNYGVPQMRQRVYFVGIKKDSGHSIANFKWPAEIVKPSVKDYLVDENNLIKEENFTSFIYYLNNPTNNAKNKVEDFLGEEFLIIDTRMSDLRLYRERVPTLRSQRDGIFYVKNGALRDLTGYEALLLQGVPQKIAIKVKDKVSDRHLLMQAGNAMTVSVIKALGKSLLQVR